MNCQDIDLIAVMLSCMIFEEVSIIIVQLLHIGPENTCGFHSYTSLSMHCLCAVPQRLIFDITLHLARRFGGRGFDSG